MSAKVASQASQAPKPDGQSAKTEKPSRRLEVRLRWIAAAVAWLILVTLVALLQAPSPMPVGAARWSNAWNWFRYPVESNPSSRLQSAPGRLASVHSHVDGRTAWAVGGGGLVMLTHDRGQHWMGRNTGVPFDLQCVTFLDDGQRGWAVGNRGTILRTQDGGGTWSEQASGTRSKLLAVDFADDGLRGAAVGTLGTVLMTSDGGRSWSLQPTGYPENLTAVAVADDGSKVWAVTVSGSILSTVNAGKSWSLRKSDGNGRLGDIEFAGDGLRGWVVGSAGMILFTNDGGASWELQNTGGAANLNAVAFAADGLHGWAVGNGGLVLTTADGGRTWTRALNDAHLSDLYSVTLSPDGQQGWIVGAGGAILATADGGVSWAAQTGGMDNVLYSLAFSEDGLRGWGVGANGLILATFDGGDSWSRQNSGVDEQLNAVASSPDGAKGWIVGRSGTILLTDDGGSTWSRQDSGVGGTLNAIHFSDDMRRGWVVGNAGTILGTEDGGKTWVRQQNRGGGTLTAVTFMKDGQQGWAVGAPGRTLLTTDGGKSWLTQASPVEGGLHSVVFSSDGQQGWAVGEDGVTLRTQDGGRQWREITQYPWTLQSIRIVADGPAPTLIAAGVGGAILLSTDGGSNWVQQNSPAGSSRIALWVQRDGKIWAAGYPPALLSSVPGEPSWKSHPSPLRYSRHPAPWYWASLLLLPVFIGLAFRTTPDGDKNTEGAAALAASDAPIKDFDQDRLQFGPLARGISRFLRNPATEPPLTLAVSGDWGSGKSTLMHLVCSDLRRNGCRPVWFNAWHHQSDEQMLSALLSAVRGQALPNWLSLDGLAFRAGLLWRRSVKHYLLASLLLLFATATIVFMLHDQVPYAARLSSLTKLLSSLGQSGGSGLDWIKLLGPIGSIVGVLVALTRALKAFGMDPAVLLALDSSTLRLKDAKAATSFRAEFAREFGEVADSLPYPLVIVIDDLDRCRPEAVLNVMEGVNFLTSSGPCFVIFGMATQRVRAALAVSFERIAREMVEIEVARPGVTPAEPATGDVEYQRRQRYATEYLEKLINLEIQVPQREDVPAAALLSMGGVRERSGSGVSRLGPNGFMPLMLLVMALVVGWSLGINPLIANFLKPSLDGGQPRITTETEPIAPAPVIGPGIKPSMPATEKARQGQMITPSVQPGLEQPVNWPIFLFPAVAALVLMLLYSLVKLRGQTHEVRDSEPFKKALQAWVPVVRRCNGTPRSVKRFGNRVRYLAMLQQAEQLDESGWDQFWRRFAWWRAASTAPASAKSTALAEHRIVALGALHCAYGAQWRSALEVQAPEDPYLIRNAINSYRAETEIGWPPSKAEQEAFERALKGVRLPGDTEVLDDHAPPEGRPSSSSNWPTPNAEPMQ